MRKIVLMLKELKKEMVKVVLIHSFLDSALLFLLLAIVFTLLNISLRYLGIPLFLVFIIIVTFKIRKNTLRDIERRHPEVNEMLRTAEDTQGDESFMVKAFHFDLFKAVKMVDSASFINMPRLMGKIFGVLILSFATVMLASSHFHVVDLGKYIDTGMDAIGRFDPSDLIPGGKRVQDDSVADLSDQTQQVELSPLSYELDISSVSKPDLERQNDENHNQYPVEAVHAESYEGSIPADQREIVKNYFMLIR
ncbi:MAG: hypothetical protein KJ709_05185 [Nanoarchaeota archaeon]|nr:hypothetical protein [Nanoarchaeota archaeon]